MRNPAVRWWRRMLLFIVTALVLTVHSAAFPPSETAATSPVPAVSAITASSAPPCEEGHSRGCPHESCAEAGAGHCAAMLTNLNGSTVDPDLAPDYGDAPDARTGRLPRSAERTISLAQLQVWRH